MSLLRLAIKASQRDRYMTCLACPHIISKLENDLLRAAVDCPTCGRPETFGLGVFAEDFEGYTWKEATDMAAEKRARGWLPFTAKDRRIWAAEKERRKFIN